jgi:hypothetical protein
MSTFKTAKDGQGDQRDAVNEMLSVVFVDDKVKTSSRIVFS